MNFTSSPTPFLESLYLAHNPDVRSVVDRGLLPSGSSHWKEHGEYEERAGLRVPHMHFDAAGYFHLAPQVKNLLIQGRFDSPFAHYLSIRRNPEALRGVASTFLFDEHQYLRANTDVAVAVGQGLFICGLDHWLLQGRHEERLNLRSGWRAPYFDRKFYLRYYPDVGVLIDQGIFASPEEHWLLIGRGEVERRERPVFPGYDEDRYLDLNPDVARGVREGKFVSGYDHWLRQGRREERMVRRRPLNPTRNSQEPSSLQLDQRQLWDKNGFLILERFLSAEQIGTILNRVEHYWASRHLTVEPISADIFIDRPETQRRVLLRDAPDHAKAGSYKVNDLYLFDESVAAIALDEQLCTVLRPLLGGDPTACYSLNFERGSQQPFHLDTLYMPGPTPDSMLAAWFCLEDVHPDAGPLLYYPGSHMIPRYLFSNGATYAIHEEMPLFETHIEGEVRMRALEPIEFLPKAGDILIWHEQLYHGGAAIRDPSRTRKSMVVHYWRSSDLPVDSCRPVGKGRYVLDRAPLTPL
jgi:phytanoyl-CoA hydroxylase